jgi:hypothetical protein
MFEVTPTFLESLCTPETLTACSEYKLHNSTAQTGAGVLFTACESRHILFVKLLAGLAITLHWNSNPNPAEKDGVCFIQAQQVLFQVPLKLKSSVISAVP